MIDNQKYEPLEDLFSQFREGETVIVDKGCCNQDIVTIIEFNGRGYCSVIDQNNFPWSVSVMRLSKS